MPDGRLIHYYAWPDDDEERAAEQDAGGDDADV
jgi:hypothetical protein